jgi:O-methyltransferase
MTLVANLLRDFSRRNAERRKARRFHKLLPDFDDEAQQTILLVRDYTMLNPEKLYAFISAVRYVSKQQIGGDIVECGVWRGGAVMAAALTLLQLGTADRRFFLYDTFAGMPRPSARDRPLAKEVEPVAYFAERQTGATAPIGAAQASRTCAPTSPRSPTIRTSSF